EQNLAEVIMAIKMGGTYFLGSPFKSESLQQTVHQILEGMTFEMLEVYGDYPWYLTTHPKVEELLKMAKNISMHSMDVILCGEQGTGKDALAKFIHQNGPNRNRQIATLNLGYFQGPDIETHFWSALREIYQEYESNVAGQQEPLYSTLFIQGLEVPDVYFRISLLEWLKQKRVEAEKKIQRPIRVILGLNSADSLKGAKEEVLKDFVWLNLLALRERREDIPLLIDYLINKYNQEYDKNVEGCTFEALKSLMIYSWPGNLRELQLMIDIILSRIPVTSRQIQKKDLPTTIAFLAETINSKRFSAVIPLAEATDNFEKNLLQYLFEKRSYDKNKISEFLLETPDSLEDKIVKHNLSFTKGGSSF
ncbi:MAG: sigma 54-interacting transcriptional regulator, partial [Candidatus Margulisbacteria bacterium]|nr:sigma 54-interacting transcriptional regulator [Candidatus Margulisiibacteriota bacterium]